MHTATAGSGYQKADLHAATWFSTGDQNNGWFQMGGAKQWGSSGPGSATARDTGLTLDLTDAQAVAAVGRVTRGNFRLIHRMFVQIERVMRINDLAVITSDVVEAARSILVIGDT